MVITITIKDQNNNRGPPFRSKTKKILKKGHTMREILKEYKEKIIENFILYKEFFIYGEIRSLQYDYRKNRYYIIDKS
ncbi:hypothetical protein A2Z22_01070 [Candidatus Woesebacteria bacterium RBG_16_34_12]|uniref:Uncharacterized protein n=1 Tax=Candidatus Woesebacteria bacterium RBG_16_34_12 TaxID=1802480 RepID=A0A1F7X7Z2_9BACT|nr:MAG: hypothetical protein A2Z22_01070 [Candidatus Woesebacteria bacterium RBG_16_34_12]